MLQNINTTHLRKDTEFFEMSLTFCDQDIY